MWSRLFVYRARVGRSAYAFSGLVTAVLVLVATGASILPVAALTGSDMAALVLRGVLYGVALFLLLYAVTYFALATVARLRDMGQSPLFAVFLLIPGLSWIVFWLILSLVPSRDPPAVPAAA